MCQIYLKYMSAEPEELWCVNCLIKTFWTHGNVIDVGFLSVQPVYRTRPSQVPSSGSGDNDLTASFPLSGHPSLHPVRIDPSRGRGSRVVPIRRWLRSARHGYGRLRPRESAPPTGQHSHYSSDGYLFFVPSFVNDELVSRPLTDVFIQSTLYRFSRHGCCQVLSSWVHVETIVLKRCRTVVVAKGENEYVRKNTKLAYGRPS